MTAATGSPNALWWLATDPRVVGVSLAAQGLLLRLVAAGGSVELLRSEDAEETLAAMVGGARGAAEAAREIVVSGVVRVHSLPEGRSCLALSPPARPMDMELVGMLAPAPTSPAQPPDDPRPGSNPWAGKPSDGPAARRARADRHRFVQRAKGWSQVARDVTWEGWLATPAGREWLAAREEDYPGYTLRAQGTTAPSEARGNAPSGREVTPPEARGNAPVTPRVTPPGNAPLARASSAGFSCEFSEKTTESLTPASEGGNAPVTPPGNAPLASRVTPLGKEPLCPPPPPLGAAAPTDRPAPQSASGDRPATATKPTPRSTTPILDAIASRAPRVSVRSVPLGGREAAERALATYPNTSPAEVLRAMQHTTHVEWIAKRTQPLPLTRVMDDGFRILGELLDAARICPICNPKGASALASSTGPNGQHGFGTRPSAPPATPPKLYNGMDMAEALEARSKKAAEARRAAVEAARVQQQPQQQPQQAKAEA